MSLEIRTEESGTGLQKVIPRGRLDTNTAPQLESVLDSLPIARVIVFDLVGLEYISSAGLRTIFKAKKTTEAAGGRALVVNPQPQVKKVFDIVKALPSDSIFTSWDELDQYLDGIQRKIVDGE